MFLFNRYTVIFIFFLVWMFFFDSNSWLVHQELNREIQKLHTSKQYYTKEIAKDKADIERLSSISAIEAYAREQYYFKRENEEVFLITCDSVQKWY